MKTIITITNVKNANELDKFVPVEGAWSVAADYRAVCDPDDIAQAVQNYMAAEYKIRVKVFTESGREITGDMPACGTFLATRKR